MCGDISNVDCVVGESTRSGIEGQLWYNRFKEGPITSTTDENMESVKKMILDNRRMTIREFSDDVGISFGSCQAIFTDVLGMKRAAEKIVPKLLNFEQKQSRMISSRVIFSVIFFNHSSYVRCP